MLFRSGEVGRGEGSGVGGCCDENSLELEEVIMIMKILISHTAGQITAFGPGVTHKMYFYSSLSDVYFSPFSFARERESLCVCVPSLT